MRHGLSGFVVFVVLGCLFSTIGSGRVRVRVRVSARAH